MSISMFERLQGLPLLMGLSVNELMTIVEEVNFAFDKYYDGDTIVNQGDRCDKIIYVLRGKLCAYRRDDHHQFHIYEYFDKAPHLIEPQNLWGMQQRFERTYSFTDEGNTCCIDKRQLNYLLSNYEIVKTNFINLICNKLQTTSKLLNEGVPPTTEQRLLQFLRNNKICHNGSTSIKIKMENLASIISDTRLNVSKVLNDWQSRGLIELQRGCITITDDTMLFNLQ